MTPVAPDPPALPVLVTCEHGGRRVPAAHRALFRGGQDVLDSHRGWDPGALFLARSLANGLGARLRESTVTRLLVDLNRSPTHPRVFSEFSRVLPLEERERILQQHHAPYRTTVLADVSELAAAGDPVLHLGIHSFTPVLDGEVRDVDLALLYDPRRSAESALCSAWVAELRRRLPDLAVGRNRPYRGVSDGLTTWLRGRFPDPGYLGIEVEVNQRLLGRGGRFPRRVGHALAAGLRGAVRAGGGLRRAAVRAGAGAALVAGLLAPPAQAQLRPLDPLDWRSVGFEGARVSVGAGLLSGQRASLAGTEGRLLEVGSLRAVWGLGRVSVEVGGTALWIFEDRTIHAPPAQDVFPPDGARRRDVGEVHVATVVRLGRWSGGREAALRFGARLPTGDNQQGMERDRTDFFALLAGRTGGARWEVGGEVGLGVHGTRDDWNEQVDPVLFGASGRFEVARAVAMVLELTGQYDPRSGPPQRGNENLAETRLGIRLGSERWIQASLVRGWARHSPTLGALVRVGKAFGT